MYNRYIPNPDGSFDRRAVQSPQNQPKLVPESPPVTMQQPAPPQPENKVPPAQLHLPRTQSTGSFLRNLLPKEFDTGDLLVVLLFLLIASECEEEKPNALLTLALYFFM